jgi:hypothetical protein
MFHAPVCTDKRKESRSQTWPVIDARREVHPPIARLQSTYGNQAVLRALASSSPAAYASSGVRHQEGGSSSDTPQSQDADYDREHLCVQTPDPSQPTRKVFSQRERQRASFGLSNAQSIASQAYSHLGRRDPYYLRMAQQAFGQPVNFATLDQNVGRVRDALNGLHIDDNVRCGTCNETGCNNGSRNFVAFTLNDLSGVVLCPFYFTLPARTLVTTFLHEAGHVANIDVNWTPGNEVYCRADDVIECDHICPITGQNLLLNVDAWARFIYCLAMSG